MSRDLDIVVIGGGHAGVEAVLAAARMGNRIGLLTMDRDKLALMSCNPAIGGIGKSHIVKEIDALGGLMGEAIDATGIQFRRLNLSRGPAVWSTRAQADRIAYTEYVSQRVADDDHLEVIEGTAAGLIVEGGAVVAVTTEAGESLSCRAVILCTGTFLGGLIHVGETQTPSGRRGEPAAYKMSESLAELGFELGRLKTGTPPRLDGNSIDFGKTTPQLGEEPAPLFSSRSRPRQFTQVPCHLTYTSAATKAIVSTNANLSPIFSGQIKSTGPRYCPSIEDKYHRFPDRERHQIFLEPEGNDTAEIYPSGFSSALPLEVQEKAIRTVVGLEKAVITQPGYAIEYDYCLSYQIKPSLETKRISGLFLAGQINGTSGYEEAAGQGIMAGINAALLLANEPPLVLSRAEAYIGVMIDDICTRSLSEPYRMFTSRAEYRLALREDNARDRLSHHAANYGLVGHDETRQFKQLQKNTERAKTQFRTTRVEVAELGVLGERFVKTERTSLENVLKQPHISIEQAMELVPRFCTDADLPPEVVYRSVIQIRYQGYLDKQQREIDKALSVEQMTIPAEFDYAALTGLKTEARDCLIKYRPSSLGQAGRLAGVTPGDVAVLSVFLKREQGKA